METYPAALKPDFMGPPPPKPSSGYGLFRADHHMSHFHNYRNEEVSRMMSAQIHRDQYKDDSGRLHPMDYFKVADYAFQCPKDPTSRYLKYSEYYVKYKQPITLPMTLERSLNTPLLPQRALTGVYNPSSNIAYKR
ncbi:unnamed protein product [Acanthoscelides obtectus]|uniref:Uncharacterized protein n=1 Tax=Acanthoscelides obtectus TaxID=200917 RepID=A0A9P0NTA9_ACAOB|nr:unnamed protein product [Acanthoscelides obtectus]CAK1672874.1 hypothetical protein AOBTE_LOCUS29125 [Acanthoscelides obtectus]